MVILPLDSTDNKVVRRVRRLLQSRTQREKTGCTILEGTRVLDEALKHRVVLDSVLYSARLVSSPEGRSLLARLQLRTEHVLYVTDRLLSELSQVEAHQGVLAVARLGLSVRSDWPLPESGPPLLVAASAIQDPGNLGTIIRAARAAGAHAVGVTKGTVEVFGPKTVRASAGSVFGYPVFQLEPEWAKAAGRQELKVTAAVAEGGTPYDAYDWTQPTVLVLGNEGNGLAPDPDWVPITIPMVPGSNSLNVAMAASVLLFFAELSRRRAGIASVPPPKWE